MKECTSGNRTWLLCALWVLAWGPWLTSGRARQLDWCYLEVSCLSSAQCRCLGEVCLHWILPATLFTSKRRARTLLSFDAETNSQKLKILNKLNLYKYYNLKSTNSSTCMFYSTIRAQPCQRVLWLNWHILLVCCLESII